MPVKQVSWFPCCAHCGCVWLERVGHPDTCPEGCNDDDLT